MHTGKLTSFKKWIDWWKGAPAELSELQKPAALERIKALLDEEEAPYRMVLHPEARSSLRAAESIQEVRREVVKIVIVHTGDEYGMVAFPSRFDLDLARFARMIEVRRVSFVDEKKLKEIFPDCAVGIPPAFGNLYGLPVYLDQSLARERLLFLPAGSPHEFIEMWYQDYDRIVKPIVGHYVLEPIKRVSGAE